MVDLTADLLAVLKGKRMVVYLVALMVSKMAVSKDA